MSNALFPYVLSPAYAEMADRTTLRPLGHGLQLGLVTEGDGVLGGVRADSLQAAGMTVDAAYEASGKNLHVLLRSGAIGTEAFQGGPGGLPFAVFAGHWAAAACIAYPGLHQSMSRALGAQALLVAIPHAEAMLVFPDRDPSGYADVVQFVRGHEAEGEHPLTFGLFIVDAAGVRPAADATS